MKINVIIFGQLTDITGSKALTIIGVMDTDQLVSQLHSQFPKMAQLPYLIAVEMEVITGNTILNNNFTVALLPPYAGG